MELGSKIRNLRYKAGLTQEQLAERLGLSAQSVSKWENAVSMPDISLLPDIAEVFGVSIDELFDLTNEQKLRRIENRMDTEEELDADIFREYEEFLKSRVDAGEDRQRSLSLLAHLYHHRLSSFAAKTARCAREAILLEPGKKDCQWLLQEAEGSAVWDWNVSNHSRSIEFFRQAIDSDRSEPKSALPFYYLIDNLLTDRRIAEAREYLERMKALPSHNPRLVPAYEAAIALGEFDEKRADAIIEKSVAEHPDDDGYLFEAAQYYARKCGYDRAAELYEASFEADKERPRFYDPLQAVAMICEIRGDYGKAVEANKRILRCLREEWGFRDEVCVREIEREIDRLMRR